VLRLVPIKDKALTFGYMPLSYQASLVADMSRAAVTELLGYMRSDERVDLFNTLPEARRESLLPALAQAQRDDIRRLASYEEGSIGAIMSSEYATLSPDLTAAAAVSELRRIAPDSETIYNAYVIDDERRLLGLVTLRRLIVAAPFTSVTDIMEPDPVTAYVDEEQNEAARKIARYDFIALPIIDRDGRVVGIVTADDAMDVAADEATEDFHKAGGSTGALTMSLKEAGIALLYRKRVVWLVLLVFVNVFSGAGIAHFEDLIAANVALVFFLPLLIDSGGNAGSQSATLMVRALATGDVVMRDWLSMLGRELTVAGLLGLTMAGAVSLVGIFRGGPAIALVVALTMLVIVIVGSLVGMLLPFALSRFNADPASASSPLITTIADISGILIYFTVASMLLPKIGVG
ncbi:MAG TPA: magnesium transporter, partial [Salinisphaeraceae bacterium]|nr:magnesium transporter [Salinisphaeraceae bacterium]